MLLDTKEKVKKDKNSILTYTFNWGVFTEHEIESGVNYYFKFPNKIVPTITKEIVEDILNCECQDRYLYDLLFYNKVENLVFVNEKQNKYDIWDKKEA